MNSPAISVKGLSLSKQKHTLLQDISFEVERGTICGLLGPSGAGKTTLMRAIMGIQIPSSGELEVIGHKPGSRYNRHHVGYVTQAPSVYSDLTVGQNLNYFARLVGADKKAIEQAATAVRLEGKHSQLVQSLSGGERTRVSLAVALLGDPELLVLDEPTVGLDPLLRRDLWELFRSMAQQGKTLLVSSHVMDEADNCQQLLLLREGKLLWNDTRESLLQKTKSSSVETAFIKLMKEEA